MKSYFPPLDVVRFFAAFFVMSFHYFYQNETEIHWYRYGTLGVQLFFIISGFVIVLSLKGKSLKEFAINRFIRLYPLFWILCTLTFIITFLIPNSNPVHFTEYLLSMTMLGDQFDPFIGYTRLVDASYWTLAVELIFYTAIALFVALFSHKNIRYFFILWFCISVVAFVTHHDTNMYLKYMLVRHASYFIFGGTLALIIMGKARNHYEKYVDYTLLCLSAFFATYIHPFSIPLSVTYNQKDELIVTLLHIIFFIGIGFLVYISKYIGNKKIINTCMVLGGITYPLYLLHETIGYASIKYITNTYHFPPTTVAFTLEILIIIISYMIYRQDAKMRSWLKTKLLTKN